MVLGACHWARLPGLIEYLTFSCSTHPKILISCEETFWLFLLYLFKKCVKFIWQTMQKCALHQQLSLACPGYGTQSCSLVPRVYMCMYQGKLLTQFYSENSKGLKQTFIHNHISFVLYMYMYMYILITARNFLHTRLSIYMYWKPTYWKTSYLPILVYLLLKNENNISDDILNQFDWSVQFELIKIWLVSTIWITCN